MLVRIRLGQYYRLGFTSQTSSFVSTAFSLLFVMFYCCGPCSLASLMIYFRTWVFIILERDLQRSLSYREWVAVSTTDLLIPRTFSKLNSMLSKPAFICTVKDLMHFQICWSSTLSLQNYLIAAQTVVVIILSNSQIGFGMQKATIVRKGSSKVYSFLRKFMPQKMKLNRKGNSFWQAEQKEGRNISLKTISQMLSMKMQRLSSYSTIWGLAFKSFFISFIHESKLRGWDNLSNCMFFAQRYLLSSTLNSLRKFALLLAKVQLISMKGDQVSSKREWTSVVLPEAF